MALTSGIVYIRPIKVGYLRVEGADRDAARAAWDEMLVFLQECRLMHCISRGFGLIRGNRRTGEGDQPQCYDAAVEMSDIVMETAGNRLRVQTLPGGSYLRARHRDGVDTVGRSFSELCDEHLPAKGLVIEP